jgi:sarcosine oxidase
MMSEHTGLFDLAVIGLGAVGSASLYQASRNGARVIGIDRFNPPHDRGSSHGDTRITRQAIGEGDGYVPFVLRSHAIWDELEAATGQQLIDRCGLLLIVRGDARNLHHGKMGFLARTAAAARRYGIAHELIEPAEIMHRFPLFQGMQGDEEGYFEAGGGQVFPERCIAVQLGEARRLGADVRTGCEVHSIEPDGSGVAIRTAGGTVRAAKTIVAGGAWMPRLAPSLASRLKVYRQTLHWFPLSQAGPAEAAPTWIWNREASPSGQFYGFPSPPGSGEIKCAGEQYDQTCDPDRLQHQVDVAESAAIFDQHVRGRLRGVGSVATRAAACCYTVAPDSDFIVEQHPDSDAITLVSACSGHGFKHSAGIGEALAGQALSNVAHPLLAPFEAARPYRTPIDAP